LIRDLKHRGLLGNTLVWGGEFGPTPMVEIRIARGVYTYPALV
jgi:hypothetical protein